MSDDLTIASTIRSEWLKFRTIRSSVISVLTMFVLTLGLGALVTIAVHGHWNTMTAANKIGFDPVATSLVGVILAQFAVGVIGALFVTSEYSSGSMRTSLAAVPKRTELALGKALVLLMSMLVVCEVACFAAFLMGQAFLAGPGVPTASLSNPTVLRTVFLTGLYLTLMSMLGLGLGLIIRHSAATISVFVSILLIIPLIFVFLPASWRNAVQRYEPSELGHSMSAYVPVSGDFSAWAAAVMLAIYVVGVFIVGTTMLSRRDA